MYKLSLTLIRNSAKLGSFEQAFETRDEALTCVRNLVENGFDIQWTDSSLIVIDDGGMQ